ncbi:MAG: hypothetical protein ACKO23_06015 [Gemmataceae bacterium]
MSRQTTNGTLVSGAQPLNVRPRRLAGQVFFQEFFFFLGSGLNSAFVRLEPLAVHEKTLNNIRQLLFISPSSPSAIIKIPLHAAQSLASTSASVSSILKDAGWYEVTK